MTTRSKTRKNVEFLEQQLLDEMQVVANFEQNGNVNALIRETMKAKVADFKSKNPQFFS